MYKFLFISRQIVSEEIQKKFWEKKKRESVSTFSYLGYGAKTTGGFAVPYIRLDGANPKRSGSVLAENFIDSVQLFGITDWGSGTMSLQEGQFVRWYVALLVEICEKLFLYLAGRERDSLLLVSIAIGLRVDEFRVDSLRILRLLQEDHADRLAAPVTVRSRVETFASTIRR